jgi:hypothetical protein
LLALLYLPWGALPGLIATMINKRETSPTIASAFDGFYSSVEIMITNHQALLMRTVNENVPVVHGIGICTANA